MIFVFISTRDRSVLGFTRDETGANLPSGYAPWQPATQGGAVLAGGDAEPVMAAINRQGFFLAVGGYEDEAPADKPPLH